MNDKKTIVELDIWDENTWSGKEPKYRVEVTTYPSKRLKSIVRYDLKRGVYFAKKWAREYRKDGYEVQCSSRAYFCEPKVIDDEIKW